MAGTVELFLSVLPAEINGQAADLSQDSGGSEEYLNRRDIGGARSCQGSDQ